MATGESESMKLTARLVWRVMLICLLPAIYASAQQPQAPSAIAEQRVREIIQLVNSGDRKAARAFINQNYTASALKAESLEQRVDSISLLYDLTRGIELQSVKEPKPNSVMALVRSKLTGQWRELAIELDEDGYTIVILSNYGGAMKQVNLKIRELLLAGKSV
jgi:hypothetical protein